MSIFQGFGKLDRRVSSVVLIILFFIILSLMLTMIIKIRSINATYPPREKIVSDVILKVTESHLWFEEILSGDVNEDVNNVIEQQKIAVENIEALLTGNDVVVPLVDAEQIKLATQLKKELEAFNQLTFERIDYSETSAPGSSIDQLYDKQFKIFMKVGNHLSDKISQQANEEFKYFAGLQHFSVAMEVFSFLVASIILWSIGRRRDEAVSKLVELNKNQEKIIKDRTIQLEQTIQKIQETQKKMIEQEKMAALGGMVAGVAHEINTPLGNTYTVSTHFEELVTEISHKLESGTLTKKCLSDFIRLTSEISQSMNINIKRASDLIQSFKLISTDQSNYQCREFNVRQYLDEIILSLNSLIRKKSHKVNIICDEDMNVFLYPGAIAQIITNLIQNSVIHGFENASNGEMTIRVTEHKEGMLNFTYKDNGKGVSADNCQKIFEPFYTTRRGQGGTGLGLSVVYNIVQSFGGSIEHSPDESGGFGLQFTLPLLTEASIENQPIH